MVFSRVSLECNVGVMRKLFPLSINDLENFLLENYIVNLQSISSEIENNLSINLKLLFYADDTVIKAESADDIQNALNEFYTYCSWWKLNVDVNKTKIMVFSKGAT